MQKGVYYSTIEEERVLSEEVLDQDRKRNRVYEYMCRMEEAREWMEKIIQEKIPDEFEYTLRDGVYLAKLVRLFNPDLVPFIFYDPVLQYRHTDNINRFFEFTRSVGLPVVFLFDLVDLYDGKNIPKVIYCIHALAHYLAKKKIAVNLRSLVGKAIFTDDQISKKEKEIEESGVHLPSFSNLSSAVSKAIPADKPADRLTLSTTAEEYDEKMHSPMEISITEGKEDLSPAQMISTDKEARAAAATIQAYVRSILGVKVHREIKGDSPVSIFSIRRLLPMLKGTEEGEEAVIDEFNKILIQLFAENSDLERKVSAVENRISLLIRNKIQGRNRTRQDNPSYMRGPYMKYKSLQRLFARIQDEPSILSSIIVGMRQREAESFCTSRILSVFGGARTPREEYAYLRVVEALVHAEMTGTDTPQSRGLGGLALRSFIISQRMTTLQNEIRSMISTNSTTPYKIVQYIIDSLSVLPHPLRFYSRFLIMALNRFYSSKKEDRRIVGSKVLLSLWEIFFVPIIVSPESLDLPAPETPTTKAQLIEVCTEVSKIIERSKDKPKEEKKETKVEQKEAKEKADMKETDNEKTGPAEKTESDSTVAANTPTNTTGAADTQSANNGLVSAQPVQSVPTAPSVLSDESILKIVRLAGSESISEYYTVKYIGTRPVNNVLHLTGDEVNYLLGVILNSSASPVSTRQIAEECHPFPFSLVFIVPGGTSPYVHENAGIVEKRLCKWAIIRILSHTTGKDLTDLLQNKSYEFKSMPYSLPNTKSIEQTKDKIRKYVNRLFELGIVNDPNNPTEILSLAAQDLVNRGRSSLSRKREIEATEKAISSLEGVREMINIRERECFSYLNEISSKIMERGRQLKYPAKSMLLEGYVLRMYNWQASQLDSIDILIEPSESGSIRISVLVIGIQSATETVPFDELLFLESEGETEIALETVGAVFCISKFIDLINRRFRITE